jgi:hypothetical protein
MYFLKCECVAISGLLEPLTFSNFVFNIFILLRVFIIHTTRTNSYVLYQRTTRSNKTM